jgi:Protein of unknown function (DUF2442)
MRSRGFEDHSLLMRITSVCYRNLTARPVEGVVDLTALLGFRGMFESLKSPAYFAEIRVDPELGTVVWPNGADLDPNVLYARLTGTPIWPRKMTR